jgi:hypothetical protein
MSGGFVKVYASILNSSIWTEELHVRVVWLAMLALADARGMIEGSVSGLARQANVTREQCEDALNRFLSPDPDSKTPDNEGRRIEHVRGGWHILNYRTYRERGSSTERVRRHRAKTSDDHVTPETTETRPLLLSSSVDLTTEAKEKRSVTSGNGVLETGELIQRIRSLAVSGPGGPVIPFAEVEKLGTDVLRAYKAVGGSARFLAATGKDYSFLVREFGQALSAARQDGAA